MSSKNNPENRGRITELRKYKGKTVKPVLYNGKWKGHGKYIAAQFEDGTLAICEISKSPIPYKKCSV